MADEDLEQIRRARLQQLQQHGGGGGGAASSKPSSQEDRQAAAEAEARASILGQILTAPAQDRLNRIKLVKESRATDVENRLIMLARGGQLRGKVSEDQLKQILNAMAEQGEAADGLGGGDGGRGMAGGIQVVRRGGDDDDLDDLLDQV